MKILIYCEYFAPVVGGVQTAIELLARGLSQLRPEDTGIPATISENSAVEVTIATMTPANGMDDSALPYRVIREPGLFRLVQLIRKADVIHLAGPCLLPLVLARLTRKPVVIEHHGYQAICPNGLLFIQPAKTACSGHFMERRYQECLRCCVQTMGWAGSIRALILTFPRHWLSKRVATNIVITDHVGTRLMLPHTQTIYYGIDVTPPKRDSGALHPSQTLEVAYVGRLVAEKGLPLLLEAAKRLRDDGTSFRLTFIGDGPERARLEKTTDQFDLRSRVTFTGDLRGVDLKRAVDKIDVVVMPSVWEETAGLSAIEQMMRGRLVIAADIGGLGEVVGDAGLKFTPHDSAALSSRLQQVAGDREQAAHLGRAARQRAESTFAVGCMVGKHFRLYRRIFASGRNAAGLQAI
jgi:glycosyltransferase involved in cell wall biosynthesis